LRAMRFFESVILPPTPYLPVARICTTYGLDKACYEFLTVPIHLTTETGF
jgi:hypothetical protein